MQLASKSKHVAQTQGMITMRQDGYFKALTGKNNFD